MNRTELSRHQRLTIATLKTSLGLATRISDDMLELVRTYAQLSETGYVQLPFMLEKSRRVPSPHFWVSLKDGDSIIALAAFRTLQNGPDHQTCAAFMADGGLYPSQGGKPEAYLRARGPMLEAGARFGYLGAGWVHPRWRGHNLAGYISRIVFAEAVLRAEHVWRSGPFSRVRNAASAMVSLPSTRLTQKCGLGVRRDFSSMKGNCT